MLGPRYFILDRLYDAIEAAGHKLQHVWSQQIGAYSIPETVELLIAAELAPRCRIGVEWIRCDLLVGFVGLGVLRIPLSCVAIDEALGAEPRGARDHDE